MPKPAEEPILGGFPDRPRQFVGIAVADWL